MIKKIILFTFASLFIGNFYAMYESKASEVDEERLRDAQEKEYLQMLLKKFLDGDVSLSKEFEENLDKIKLIVNEPMVGRLEINGEVKFLCVEPWVPALFTKNLRLLKQFVEILGVNLNQAASQNLKLIFWAVKLFPKAIDYLLKSHRFCAVCKISCRMKCGACRVTHYCSVGCQKKDWPAHKVDCPNILSNKIDVNIQDFAGDTLLIFVLKYANSNYVNKIVKSLIEAKVDVNACDKEGRSSLMIAFDKNQIELVQMLIEAGADVNIGDKFGMTPLMIAVHNNHIVLVKILLKAKNLNIHLRNELEETVFDLARGNIEITGLLKQHCKTCSKLLIFAAEHQPEAVKRLIDAGAECKF